MQSKPLGRGRWGWIAVLCTAVVGVSANCSQAAGQAPLDLDLSAPLPVDSSGNSLNMSGQIVGVATSSVPGQPQSQGCVWQVDPVTGSLISHTSLPTMGGTRTSGTWINNAGQVVGVASMPGDAISHGCIWQVDPNTGAYLPPIDLGTLGGTRSVAVAINDISQVVGSASIAGNTADHACVWQLDPNTGTFLPAIDLGTLGGKFSSASGINDAGTIIGVSNLPGDIVSHACAWLIDPNTGDYLPPVDLGTLGGTTSSARAINNNGLIVGNARTAGNLASHACIWQIDPFTGAYLPPTDLGVLGGTTSSARAINDAGQIVGTSTTILTSSALHSALWQIDSGTGAYLPPIEVGDAGASLSFGLGINDLGQICGVVGTSSGSAHACFWKSTNPGIYVFNIDTRAIGSTGAVIEWLSTAPGSSIVEYGAERANGTFSFASTATGNDGVTHHQVILKGLKSGAVYHFRVRTVDAPGNTAVSDGLAFLTDAVDPSAPLRADIHVIDPVIQRLANGQYQVDVTLINLGKANGTSTTVGAALGASAQPNQALGTLGLEVPRVVTFIFPATAGASGIRTELLVSGRAGSGATLDTFAGDFYRVLP